MIDVLDDGWVGAEGAVDGAGAFGCDGVGCMDDSAGAGFLRMVGWMGGLGGWVESLSVAFALFPRLSRAGRSLLGGSFVLAFEGLLVSELLFSFDVDASASVLVAISAGPLPLGPLRGADGPKPRSR